MIKGSEVQKERPHELLWMLWFDEKSMSSAYNSQAESGQVGGQKNIASADTKFFFLS